MEIAALILASVLFLVGVIGTFAPVLPGSPLIWLGMLLYALLTGFEPFSILFFVLQALLALAVMGVDYLATMLGSKHLGGSKAALWGSMLGLLVGFFYFPLGLLIGPFLGAVLFDLIFSRKPEQAVRAGLGATIGFWLGFPFKLALELIMIGWFYITIF